MTPAARSSAKSLLRDYRAFARGRAALAAALMIGGALAEGFGILMIVPLVGIAFGGGDVPAQLEPLEGLAAALPPGPRLLAVLGLFVTALSVRAILLFGRDTLLARLQSGHEASMQLRAGATLADRGWAFASGVGQAGMQAMLLADISRAAQAVFHWQQAAVMFILLSVQLALTAFLSPPMALIATAIILMGYGLSWRWVRIGSHGGERLSIAYDESTAAGFRLHAGLKAALAQGTVPQFLAEYRASLANVVSQSVALVRDAAFVRASAGIANALAASVLLIVGIQLLDVPLALLLPLLILFARMSGPALALQQNVQGALTSSPGFAAVERRIGPLRREAGLEPGPRRPIDWSALRLERAGYEHRPGLGIRAADLTLHSGEWLALSGDSGAGKTTLIDVIAGLLPVQTGRVLVDGTPLQGALLYRWRDSIAYVGQGDMVFDDTVRRNLLADGTEGDEDALWAALETVGLAERIRALPGQLEEAVGDRGSSLSGGERQRLTLARAILRRPSLLLLDEATNALDGDSERAVLTRLAAIEPKPAAVIVAHRAGTLDCCDRRATINFGEAVDEGSGAAT